MNNKKITHMLIILSTMFMALIVYLTVIDLYYRDDYTQSTLNQRNAAREMSIIRGSIYDRNGTVLAESGPADSNSADSNSSKDNSVQNSSETPKRVYPYKNLYSHVIGYSSATYGKSLIETAYNDELLGNKGLISITNLKNMLSGKKSRGNDITLTIDHELQKKADELMSKYNGSLVAINPQTGEILAMISKPDFNPEEDSLAKNWSILTDDKNSPFLTRATMGLYPPGSTFKVLTTAAMLKNGMESDTVNDTKGYVTFGDKDIANSGKTRYGNTDLLNGFKKSSNVFFATEASKMTDEMLLSTAESFLFNRKIDFKFPYSKSRFNTGKMASAERAMTGIGQGKTLATPLQLALVASAVANDGVMMRPYLVSKISSSGYAVEYTKASDMKTCLDAKTAQKIKDLMRETVKSGTGRSAQLPGIEVCGKTGTAENEKTDEDASKTHAVFIGFAPYDNPQIAISVVLEYAGSSGGTIAAPISRELMRKFFEINKNRNTTPSFN